MTEFSKRSCEYDMVRIWLMLMLPLIHVVQYWGYICDGADLIVRSDVDTIEPVARLALYYIAPCFMIMMGINMQLTRHNSPKDFLRRGVILLCIEFVFNLIRYVLPACIGFAIGEYKTDVMDYALFGVFNSDILAFAGLAFIVIAWFKKLHASSNAILGIAIVMWLFGLIITRIAAPWINEHCGAQALNILGSFIWVNTDSNFPLINWIIYPATGYFFVDRLHKAGNNDAKERIWRYCTVGGLVIIAIELGITCYMGLPIYENLSVNGSHHLLHAHVVLFSTSVSFVLIGACHFLSHIVERNNRMVRVVTAMGSKLTVFYLIQWTIVGWGLFLTGGTDLWGCQQLTLLPTVVAIIVITIISFLPAILSISKI